MELTLIRFILLNDLTLGAFYIDGKFINDSLELPWKDNAHNISCIPEGSYNIQYRDAPHVHVPKAYIVNNVPEREGILIHPANNVSELKGCIAIGVRCENSLFNSIISLMSLRSILGDSATLTIRRGV